MDAAHFVWGAGFLTSLWYFMRMFVRTSSGRKRFNVLGAYNAITIILGNAAYQRCKLTQTLATELGITLMFLPGDSPNLNLIERLWKFVKKQSLNHCYCETFEAFKAGINTCLNNIDKIYKSQITSFMTLRFQVLKTDHVVAG
jgi:transposase